MNPKPEERITRVSKTFEIRGFEPRDGTACHELRRAAFQGDFSGYLTKDQVDAGAGSYSARDFSERIAGMETFVAAVDRAVIGFCTIRVIKAARAEILYLYIGSGHRGDGLGSRLVRHAEQQVLEAHPRLETLYLDTAVPEYNRGFWERLGYRSAGTSLCEYPGGTIPALRLEKQVLTKRRKPL